MPEERSSCGQGLDCCSATEAMVLLALVRSAACESRLPFLLLWPGWLHWEPSWCKFAGHAASGLLHAAFFVWSFVHSMGPALAQRAGGDTATRWNTALRS